MRLYEPNVIFIGYKKGGSTFLRNYFSHHPDIYWTRNAQFFLSDEKYKLGKSYYLGLINNLPKEYKCFIDMFEGLSIGYILKNSTNWSNLGFNPAVSIEEDYLDPNPTEIARRIKNILPNVKILIVLRNQIDWLRSYYLHHISSLPERKRKFANFLSTLEGKSALYAGLFNITVDAYYKIFGKENVHVMLLEQIKDEKDKSLKELCVFIGVKFVNFYPEKSSLNIGKGKLAGSLFKIFSNLGLSDSTLASLKTLLKPLKKINLDKIIDRDVLTPNEKSIIRSFYSASNYHTSNLIGTDLKKYGYPV